MTTKSEPGTENTVFSGLKYCNNSIYFPRELSETDSRNDASDKEEVDTKHAGKRGAQERNGYCGKKEGW